MRTNLRTLTSALALALVVACGGSPTDSNPETSPSATPLMVCSDTQQGFFGAIRSGGRVGTTVTLTAPATIKARVGWAPSDAWAELYVVKDTASLTCYPDAPCENYLAADLNPSKQPKELISQQLESGSYVVWLRNRSAVTITLTSVEISACNVR